MAIVGEYALCVQDAEGAFHSFLPGQRVPGWVVDLVTNPRALLADPADDGGDPVAADEAPAPANPVDASSNAGDPGDPPAPALTPPPHAGVGSGRDAWADYANANGVAVQDDWKRDQIIEACREAGVAV